MQLRRVQSRFPDECVLIGVHSAKFPSERLTRNVEHAVARHKIEHPVVNDAGFAVWQSYAVRAWPTIVLIDPAGYVVGSHAGEIDAEALGRVVAVMIEKYDAEGLLDRRSPALPIAPIADVASPFRYPSKVALDGDRLFVADTGHHQIVELRLDANRRTAREQRRFGSGAASFADGPAGVAGFHGPHGVLLAGKTLYVADTENHAVRAVDLESGLVRTLAGTGAIATAVQDEESPPLETALRSPWALAGREGLLFIAMAGSHQIYLYEDQESLGVFAGTGREALVDGFAAQAAFNQPSDLVLLDDVLYVLDSEASAVRRIDLDGGARVETLVGEGLFEFGDRDGVAEEVRLQHPIGLCAGPDGALFLADSYNQKIKRLDPERRRVTSVIGSGRPGAADGSLAACELFEPEGLAWDGKLLIVADTNNHVLRVADFAAGEIWTLGIESPAST